MKKKVLLVAAIAAGIFTTNELNAQDFKPAGGEKNIEVNFAPLGGNPISMNNLRFRYFASSDIAYRLGFSVSSSTTKDITANQGPNSDIDLEDKTSSFGFSINPGIEKHFEGTDRLSPYVGAVLNFSTVSTTRTEESLNGSDVVETEIKNPNNDDATNIGLNLVLGADWYFSKHIYMGTEVGFGFLSSSIKDTETSGGGATITTPNGSEFNFGPNFNSSIRLGFLF